MPRRSVVRIGTGRALRAQEPYPTLLEDLAHDILRANRAPGIFMGSRLKAEAAAIAAR
jgi:hypothetical protein